MKRLLALLLLFTGSAFAQGARFNGSVLNQQGQPVAGAIVNVCSSAAVGIPCTPLANVYSNQTLTTTILQPIITDTYGRYGFWATAGAQLIVSITGRFVNSYSFPITMPGGGGGGSGTIFEVNSSPLATSTTVNFANSGLFNGLTFTFSNPSAGNVQLGASGTLANTGLQHSSITVATTGPLAGGGAVSLGGTLTLSCPTCTAGSPATLATNGVNNASQVLLNFETSTANTLGLTVTPVNTSGGIEKEEVTGILLPIGGGTGLSSPTAHRLAITEGASNYALVSMAVDTLLQGQGAGTDPAALALTNCGGADAYSTGTHSFVCNAIPANTVAVTHEFFTAYNSTTGVFTQAQPAYSDISGTPTLYYQTVESNATAAAQEPKLNLISGSNATVSCVDNSGATRTDCTITATNTTATAWSAITGASTNSNAGTFTTSGNSWDWTGVTIFKIRASAGLTTSASGDIGYDTTNKQYHGYNGADSFFWEGLVSGSFTNGHCAQIAVSSSQNTLVDSGAACGGTGTVTSFSAGNANPLFTTSVATATSTPALTFTLTSQSANLIFAGPGSGGAAAPTFRALAAADLPASFTAPLATALASTPSICSANSAPQGVLASGNATGCTAYMLATAFSSSNIFGQAYLNEVNFTQQSSAPSAPATGQDLLYFDTANDLNCLTTSSAACNLGSSAHPYGNIFLNGTITNTSGVPWVWDGPEGSGCTPGASGHDQIFIGDNSTHAILMTYNGNACAQVMLGTNSMTAHGVALTEGNGTAMVAAAPTANSQCLASAASNFATTDPSFQSCPSVFATISTTANCASSASPAVCGSAPAGSVAVPTGISSSTLQVNTSAVTANSQILLYVDDTLGTRLGVTCNSTLATLAGGSFVSARTGGTSFTITFNGTISSNPVCMNYLIVN